MLLIGRGPWLLVVLACSAAIVFYVFFHKQPTRDEALTYHPWRAVIVTDWMGILLASAMFALPIWAASEWPGDGLFHSMVWLVLPMGLVFLAFTVVGWRHEAFELVIHPDALTIDTGAKRHHLSWADIEKVSPWRRDVPEWMRRLAPFLAASGHPLQAGAIMIARESTGLAIHHGAGKPIIIPTDAFEENARRLLADLVRNDVKIERGLTRLMPKQPRSGTTRGVAY